MARISGWFSAAIRGVTEMIALREGSNDFVVTDPERYMYNDIEIVVPKGFVSDLASIPRILWGVLPPHHHRYRLAALVHDFLLTDPIIDGGNFRIFTRADIDLIFKEIMQASGVKPWKVFVMYNAVRAWSYLKSH